MNEILKHFSTAFRNVVLLSIVSLAFTACGDDSIGETGQGSLDITPSTLNFSDVVIGESMVGTINLINSDDTDIRLSDIEIGENPDRSGVHEGFELLNGWDDSMTLEAGDTYALEVRYTPQSSERHEGLITFRTNLADLTDAEVEVRAVAPTPELLADDTVTFSRIAPEDTASQYTEISNIGYADMEIDDIFMKTGNNFSVSFPVPADEVTDAEPDGQGFAPAEHDAEEPPESIAPGESLFVRVSFTAPDETFQSDQLHIETNAPNAQPRHVIAVIANSDAPCLELVDGEVAFGLASMHDISNYTVTLRNCSRVAYTNVFDISLGEHVESNDQFTAGGDTPFELVKSSLPEELQEEDGNYAIAPESSISFLVTYLPEAEEVNMASLQVTSSDEAGPLLADVSGEGADLACPIAVAEAGIAGTDIWTDDFVFGAPLEQIAFNGEDSYDPDETDVTYEWALTSRPLNSTAQITDPTSATPMLSTDIAGTFVVELTVYDDYGISSCEPATITIEIEPDADIHVELTWDVPNSPTGTGTDLDLHYLHPTGEWSLAPWGVYWANNDPDWVDGSEISLDIDDRHGNDPENINHDNPDPAFDYSVGVYYFGDQFNYGATDARIRIYLGNSLAYERADTLMTAGEGSDGATVGDFWYIADILVEPGGVLDLDVINEIHEDAGFPQ